MSSQSQVESTLSTQAFSCLRRPPAAGLVVATASLLLGAALPALASEPLTGQFQINSSAGSAQQRPASATDSAGNFVVVWESYASAGNDNSARSVQAQRFNANGSAVGPEIQVNTSIANEQKAPAVAMNSSGGFVVVWESNHQQAADFNIIAQRFSAAGAKVGSELLVNSAFTAGIQGAPAVAMATNGDFVVVWTSPGGAGGDPDIGIQGRRWRASNGTFFDQFPVNDITAGDQHEPAIATDGNLSYLVAWEHPAASQDIAIRSFTADNLVATGMLADVPQITANTYPTGAQSSPSVARTPDGRAAVVWDSFGASFGSDQARYSIQGRRITANGYFADDNDAQINTYTTDDQRFPSVSMSSTGMIAVAWASYGSSGSDNSDYSIQFRAFDTSGGALDPFDVQPNSYTVSTQWYPTAAFASNGRLLVAWESNGGSGPDTNGFSVQGRLFEVFTFADGFESGDTSKWASTTP
jgi:hypothetical protein